MSAEANKPKFSLGQVVATPGALNALQRANQLPSDFLKKHQCGDWGELCPEDARRNDEAIANEEDLDSQTRVLSVYKTRLKEIIWVITEYDRSATTILLPKEY